MTTASTTKPPTATAGTAAASAPQAATAGAALTLDALARMTVAELTALYQRGTVPDSLAALDGEPRCRMLSIVGVDRGPIATGLRRVAGSARFPWGGKAFKSSSAGGGTGINRVRLGAERRWFPFHTRFEPSAIDGAPCILLDYDLAENPLVIRKIRDELREVAPGLFLGPAMADVGARPTLVLYFACDTRPAN